MFDSGISVKNLIYELKNTEVDIALEIPNATYVEWLNSLQQIVYTEIIKEQKASEITDLGTSNTIKMQDLQISEGENTPRYEDIHAVYAVHEYEGHEKTVQLIKSTFASGVIFTNAYFKNNNDLCYSTSFVPKKIRVIHFTKPALIEVDDEDVIDDSKVMLPIEFIELAKAKLRGEAYKLANEDEIAAKWMNDYNVLLEVFKAWISEKMPTFGL